MSHSSSLGGDVTTTKDFAIGQVQVSISDLWLILVN